MRETLKIDSGIVKGAHRINSGLKAAETFFRKITRQHLAFDLDK